ncbi:MAG: flagellar motor protein MotA, partial [Xanthomonadales bacterium]|nr:flagellar motor protein MotA [Xanthomonadales bacterium]
MSRFNRALLWMSAFLVLVAVLAALVGHRLLEIFSANPFFNGVILTVLLAGIVVNLRQVIVLGRESHWMET